MSLLASFSAFLFFIAFVAWTVCGIEQCSEELGGGLCPSGNTCCLLRLNGTTTTSGCIPNDLGSYNATCCHDGGGDDGGTSRTGCAVGYACVRTPLGPFCVAGPLVTDPLVQRLPRYRLCHSLSSSSSSKNNNLLKSLHGLPIVREAKLAYYSSMGDITKLHRSNRINNGDNNESSSLSLLSSSFSGENIEVALIVVHGANRNADDYFCTAMAAVQHQQYFATDSVLVVAPRFAVEKDGDLDDLEEGGVAIRWRDDDDGNGPWRYGENAITPDYIADFRDGRGFSSYDALDKIITILNNTDSFPTLRHIVVVGHSSGAQFVQRWSLMTPHWDNINHRLRSVVANPSSYVYLSPLRLVNNEWKIPTFTNNSCSGYNKWDWGLQPGGNYTVPYVRAILKDNDVDVVRRFKNRQVVYLAGSLDSCNVSGNDQSGWCKSHGLETTCMDELEGRNRLERHHRYLASLEKLGFPAHGEVVPGVGHDHSLMINSKNGLKAIFGELTRQGLSSAI